MNFLSPPYAVTPAGVFSSAHLIYFIISVLFVAVALYLARKVDKKRCHALIIAVSLILSIMEIVKISFVFQTVEDPDPNFYIPLYFCSIEIYASLLAAFARGKLRRMGEVFMMTGGIVGGLFYIIYPLTALSFYPAFHLISIQSFVFHTLMLFIGLLMHITGYRDLKSSDGIYHAILVTSVSIVALVINLKLGSNLMFISQNYPGTIIEPFYNALPAPLFTILIIAFHALPPFYASFGVSKLISRLSK